MYKVAKIDEHTLCCLHFDKSTTKDEIGKYEWKENKKPALSDTGKFNKSLDTSQGCIYMPISPQLNDNDFTIDFWLYIKNVSAEYNTILCFNDNPAPSAPGNFILYYDFSATQIVIVSYPQTNINNLTIPFAKEMWGHIAIVRKGNTVIFYKNGKTIKSGQVSGNIYPNANLPFVIGDYISLGWNNRRLNGYIDEFRISDIARWTSDFTPPMTAYNRNLHLYLDENNAVWGCRE